MVINKKMIQEDEAAPKIPPTMTDPQTACWLSFSLAFKKPSP